MKFARIIMKLLVKKSYHPTFSEHFASGFKIVSSAADWALRLLLVFSGSTDQRIQFLYWSATQPIEELVIWYRVE